VSSLRLGVVGENRFHATPLRRKGKLFSFPQPNYQNAIFKIVFDPRPFDYCGKGQGLFKATVRYFHLVK
jgi:hypothetical protein